MHTFTKQTIIYAPAHKVWEVLADVGTIYKWNPGVIESYKTNDEEGLGASRYCDLGNGNYLKEDVVQWDEGTGLTMRIYDTNLPFKQIHVHFTLEPQGDDTVVYVSPEYQMKFGIAGKVMNRVMVDQSYQKGMQNLLDGLKEYVEKEVVM